MYFAKYIISVYVKFMKRIVLSYIIIVIIEMLYTYFYLDHWDDFQKEEIDKKIEFNNTHIDELEKYFSNEVNKRVKLLDTMSYNDWIGYNKKNKYVTFDGKKYNFFIWERNKIDEYNEEDTSNFTVRVSTHKDFENLDFNNVISLLNYNFLYGIYKPDMNIPNNLWDLTGIDSEETSSTNIFWVSEDFGTPIERAVVFNKFRKFNENKKKENSALIENEGIIGIGYEIRNLDLEYGRIYYQFLGKWFFIIVSILSFLIGLFLYYSSSQMNQALKPILFLVITNFYLMYFLSSEAGLTSVELEQNKINDINAGITAISFLIAVNIFIVQTLRDDRKTKYGILHTESAILFCVSLMLLLMASSKKTNFINIQELRIHTISSQYFFNMSILINLLIFLNYILYIAGSSKYLRFLQSY